MISSSGMMRPCVGVDEERSGPARAGPCARSCSGATSSTPTSRRHDHAVVVGDPVARRAQAVAVEHRADDRAVGERDRRGTVPRLHQRRRGSGRTPCARRPSTRGSPTPPGSSSRIAWCSGRPARLSSSSASSKRAVSDAPGVQIGNARVEVAGQHVATASRLRGRASSSRCPARC